MRIFLSYAREDEAQVTPIYEILAAAGHSPWMDNKNLVGGDAWKAEIEREIKRSDMFFIFLSPRSARKRGIIQEEIKIAFDKAREFLPRDIFIVPVLIEACDPPEALTQYHWIDLHEPNWEDSLTQTLARAEEQRSPLNSAAPVSKRAFATTARVGLGTATAGTSLSQRPSILAPLMPLVLSPWIWLAGLGLLLIATNQFVAAVSTLAAIVLAVVALVLSVIMLASERGRGSNALLATSVVVTIGAGTSVYVEISRSADASKRADPADRSTFGRSQPPNETARDLIESLDAIQACNVDLTLQCMQAGGVWGAATAGRRLMECKTADMFRADHPSLQWKDVWTTSEYSYAPGGARPGGGRDDDLLKVGGWGDEYYSLVDFRLPALPYQPRFAAIVLYATAIEDPVVRDTRLAVDRIAQPWSFPKGERLWWKDRPKTSPTDMRQLPAPGQKHWYMIELTTLVLGWRDNAFPNYGIQIMPVENDNNYVFFASSDAADKSKIPRLLFCP